MKEYNNQKADKAKALFMQGYNCSQSVMGAWAEELGMDLNTAYKVSSGFGGGMGRMREVCGAFSGALMVLGLKYGNVDGADQKAKGENYKLVQAYAARFKEMNAFDSIICREMLGLTGKDNNPNPAPRTNEYYKKRPCPELIAMASGLLGEFM